MEENIITSVQNARIKHVVALQQKSSLRREEGLFVVEGQREIEHCIACGYEIVELFVLEGLDVEREHLTVTPQVYEKMAYRGSTEGIIAVVICKDHKLSTLHSPLRTTPSWLFLKASRSLATWELSSVRPRQQVWML